MGTQHAGGWKTPILANVERAYSTPYRVIELDIFNLARVAEGRQVE